MPLWSTSSLPASHTTGTRIFDLAASARRDCRKASKPILAIRLQRKPSSTSDSPCNWSQTNHVHSHGIAQEEIGCGRMGGLAGPHINTTLVILIGALYANARLLKQVPTPTKKQARERAAHSALGGISDGGFARGRTSSRLHCHRSIPRRASSRFRRSALCRSK
jgi:hypothetical protein